MNKIIEDAKYALDFIDTKDYTVVAALRRVIEFAQTAEAKIKTMGGQA